jgi:hypothetical protein
MASLVTSSASHQQRESPAARGTRSGSSSVSTIPGLRGARQPRKALKRLNESCKENTD